MKNIEELKRCTDVKELEFYLEYNTMIEDMMNKRGLEVEQLTQETEVIKQRLTELSENN